MKNNSPVADICLLDDDPSVLKAMGRLLRSAGWAVEMFRDPASFLHHAQVRRPRLAVIDIWMPFMNGLEVQKRLRELSPSTRVIVVTARDEHPARSKAMEAGASAFFLKPVKDSEFLAEVESAFGKD